MLSDFSALVQPLTALTVNVYLSAIVGVPVIAPVEVLRVSPSGRVPDDIDHVTGESSAARVAVYAVPVVPSGRLVVVIVSVGAEIVTVNCFSSLAVP